MPAVLTQRIPAPEISTSFDWWNTSHPLTLQGDLKGCVVVLDFWTYCCINCLHQQANLEQAAASLRGEPFVVIGVHSAKFPNETIPANIRAAILRSGISHPIVIDEEHQLWRQYGVSAWPTLVFIDSEGRIAATTRGETPPEEIERTAQSLLAEGRQHGTLAPQPPPLRGEATTPSASDLAFPGKITADPSGGRLFIADSGNHCVHIADVLGHLLHTIGSGEPGAADGPFDTASFRDPQGLAFDSERGQLYVADPGNHLIRRVDLAAGRVETILGTGQQVHDRAGGGRGSAQGLDTPWDLALAGTHLYIAMAGAHQIWRMELATAEAAAWAGSGREGLIDGPGFNAALAQPSGLAILGEWLYFADSESSALRRARLRDGDVETLAGHDLFDFGDADGAFGRARLQHPLGVATDGRDLFIADTYNHKIKRLSLEERTITTLAGDGRPGTGNPCGAVAFYEPGGLVWLGGRLYIADTNNHRIVVFDQASGAWHELALRGLRPTAEEEAMCNGYPTCTLIAADAQSVELCIEPALVEGFHFDPLAHGTVVVWEPESEGGLLSTEGRRIQCTLQLVHIPVSLTLPVALEKATTGRLLIDFTFASCTDRDPRLCKPERRRWDLAWQSTTKPAHTIRLVGGAIGIQ